MSFFPMPPDPTRLDPISQAIIRQRALAAIPGSVNRDAKGGLQTESVAPGKSNPDVDPTRMAGLNEGPNAYTMPSLVSNSGGRTTAEEQQPAAADDPVQTESTEGAPEAKPANGPTDLTRLGDTAATPVAAAANPLDAAVGEEVDTKPKGSFFDNPAASDSMIAFGAAMLRAPNFNTGLANGAEAVGKALEPYEMPTSAEIARAALKAKFARQAAGGGGAEYSSPATALAPDGTMFVGGFNKGTGRMEWTNEVTGEKVSKLPPGTMPRQDSGFGKAADLAAKAEDEFLGIASDAPGTIARINGIQRDYLEAGGEAGAIAAGKRYIGNLMGWSNDYFGDLSKRQEVESVLRQMELDNAKSQRGLGQLTEGERVILREVLPNLGSTPEAFYRITEVMKAHAERARDIAESWDNLSSDERAKYRGSVKRYALAWDKENDYQGRIEAIRTAEVPAFMKQKTPAPGAPGAAPSQDARTKANSYLD